MKVGFLSTYPPQRCGIATYTEALVSALKPLRADVVVFSEVTPAVAADEPEDCQRVFVRRRDWSANVLDAVCAAGVDLLHVQHAPDIFGMDRRLLRLLADLRARGVASVVTLHTVHTPISAAVEGAFGTSRFHRELAAVCDALLVHGEATMADALRLQGVPADKVTVIPHGTAILNVPSRSESRAKLGLPANGALFLYFGFIRVQKNIHTIIKAFYRVRKEKRDAKLLIVGSVQGGAWFNRWYLAYCRRLVRRLKLTDSVELQDRFASANEIPMLYGAADVVLLPYAQRYGSASGVVHSALGANRLVLCSSSPKFAEIRDAVDPYLIAPTFDAKAWASRLVELTSDEEKAAQLIQKLASLAAATSWPVVAGLHQKLYERLVKAKRAAAPLETTALNR